MEGVLTGLAAAEKFRKDYKKPPFTVRHTFLHFELDFDNTIVIADLYVVRQPEIEGGPPTGAPADLILDGAPLLKLRSVYITPSSIADVDGFKPATWPEPPGTKPLIAGQDYVVNAESLVIKAPNLPVDERSCVRLRIEQHFSPAENLALEGLYRSNDLLCTQCESQGFRCITYSLDRPDVLSKYSVVLAGNKAAYPVLLSNGNVVTSGSCADAEGDLDSNYRKTATWSAKEANHFVHFHDPHPKPSYLFAVVAGDLFHFSYRYVRRFSGRPVHLNLWCEPRYKQKLAWAMTSLVKAMHWDEEEFGLEYDLDFYHLVAVSDFNQGAMENKGLNIFDAVCLLASPESATDSQHQQVTDVIAHEYFHNYTGNRVTLRDWFQLTLKEGLTMLRESLFAGTQRSTARLEEVRTLRAHQFPEDAGPLSHPIRPESYVVMDNFYTATVYDKGNEVCRLYRTLLGRDLFRAGLRYYLHKFDGQGATCDDFLEAMIEGARIAAGNDPKKLPANLPSFDALYQLSEWYSQAGTPVVTVDLIDLQNESGKVKIAFTQQIPQRPDDKPLLIPISLTLIGLKSKAELFRPITFALREKSEVLTLENIEEPFVMSLLRGFSAPIKLRVTGRSRKQLAFLMVHDTDSFVRVDSSRELFTGVLVDLVRSVTQSNDKESDLRPTSTLIERFKDLSELPAWFLKTFEASLSKVLDEDYAVAAEQLSVPSQSTVEQQFEHGTLDPIAVYLARKYMRRVLGTTFQKEFRVLYKDLTERLPVEYEINDRDCGLRRLRNFCLEYLTAPPLDATDSDALAIDFAYQHYKDASSFNDQFAGAGCIIDLPSKQRTMVLDEFLVAAQRDPMLLEQWLRLNSMSDIPDALQATKELTQHPAFRKTNPNCISAVYRSFASANILGYHDASGHGYEFLAESIIQVAAFNGQSAAGLTSDAFGQLEHFAPDRSRLMQDQVHRLLLSCNNENVQEVASRILRKFSDTAKFQHEEAAPLSS